MYNFVPIPSFLQHQNTKTSNSFINRNSKLWNKLDLNCVNSGSILEFKQNLKNLITKKGEDWLLGTTL